MIPQPSAAPAVQVVDTPEGFVALRGDGCAAVIYDRPAPQGLRAWLDALRPEALPTTRIVMRPEAIRQAALDACEAAGTPATAERDALLDDIDGLAAWFSQLMAARWLRLRLDVVTTDACRKFHVDALTARLVCTYRGTGTQYGFAAPGQEPAEVHTVPTGAPILMRGRVWPNDPPAQFLHRSPPIAGTGETRLVLVLDPLDGPEEAF